MPPSDVPRRVRTATGVPPTAAALFLRRHGVSDISDGIANGSAACYSLG
jgi:hypothetical protein